MDLQLRRFENRSMQERPVRQGRPKKAEPSQRDRGDHLWTGVSADGHLRYALRRTPDGLVVERLRIAVNERRALQAVSFPDEAAFGEWCDEDGMRYEYNQLCAAVKKRGLELFELSIGAAHAQQELRFG